MNLDPRIIEGKRVLTPFDVDQAEQFNGQLGYFSNYTDDFKSLENAGYGVLDLTFGEYPYRYKNDHEESHGCLYFLPEAWVKKELDHEIIFLNCREVQHELSGLFGRLNILLNCICDTTYGFENPGDKSMVWHMRDILKKAYLEYRSYLKDFEEGNY